MPLGAIGRPLIYTCESHGRPMGCTCNATWMTLGSPNCNTKGCDTISHSLVLPEVTSLHFTMCHHHGCYNISHQVLLQVVTTISAQPITSLTSFTSSSSMLNCIMLHLTSHHKNMQLCASYMLPYVTTRAVTICHNNGCYHMPQQGLLPHVTTMMKWASQYCTPTAIDRQVECASVAFNISSCTSRCIQIHGKPSQHNCSSACCEPTLSNAKSGSMEFQG